MLIRLDLQNTNGVPKLGEGSQPWQQLISPKRQGARLPTCHRSHLSLAARHEPQLHAETKNPLSEPRAPGSFETPMSTVELSPSHPFQRQLAQCLQGSRSCYCLSSSCWIPLYLKDGRIMLLSSKKRLHGLLLHATSLWSKLSLLVL